MRSLLFILLATSAVFAQSEAPDDRILQRTGEILSGGPQTWLVSTIQESCRVSQTSANPEIGYCAIALAAFDGGKRARSYSYMLAGMYFRDPDTFVSLLSRIAPESRAPVVDAVKSGAVDIVGDEAEKAATLQALE